MTIGKTNIYYSFYFWLLAYIAVSMPLSIYTTSMGSLLLLVLWLLGDFQGNVVRRFYRKKGFFAGCLLLITYLTRLSTHNILEKTRKFIHNRAAVVFASIYFLHLAGMLFTSNFDYGFKDLRVKLPLLFFPLIFSSMEKLDYPRFRKLLLYYVGGIFIATLVGGFILMKGDYLNIRYISPFISSIRLGLNITFGVFILLYFVAADTYFHWKQKLLMGILSLWFVVFLVKLESITSLSIIFVLGMAYLVYLVFKSQTLILKGLMMILIIAIPLLLYIYVSDTIHSANTVSSIEAHPDKFTALGNPYTFDTINQGVEDGKYVGWYLCESELESAWDKRSKIDFGGRDKRGNELKETLIRFLSSKNLHKDAAGIAALTSGDIQMVENGIANYNYIAHPGLHSRILKILKGYQVYEKSGNPSGSSLMQRLEYLKASLGIIKNHFWLGVGTGDLQDAFYARFSAMHSQLSPQYRFHAHNQYLAIFVAFGVFGFIIFLFALVYPVIVTHGFHDYFFVVFYIIMLLSMFSDDTLETHAGVTLFAFFTSLILFGKQRKNA